MSASPSRSIAPVRAARFEAMAEAFAHAVPGCRRSGRAGWRMDAAASPGELDRPIVDEEGGWLPAARLPALGWPVDAWEADDGVLAPWPWLAVIAAAECEGLLSIDGIEAAPPILAEPAAGAHLEGAFYEGSLWLAPQRWACLSLWCRMERHDDAPLRAGAIFVGLRRVEEGVAVVALSSRDASRAGMRALLAVEQADVDVAHTRSVHGSFRSF